MLRRSDTARRADPAVAHFGAGPGSDAAHAYVTLLFNKYRDSLQRYLCRLVPADDAAELVQETYFRLLRHGELVQIEAMARAFLFHTATNLARDHRRRRFARLADRHVSVVVLSGSVSVAANAQGSSPSGPVVTAGRRVSYIAGESVSPPVAADVGIIRGWQAHRIVFSDVTLATALQEYNRYMTVPIVLGNPELAEQHISGVFVIGDENAFLGALQQGLHLKAARDATQTTLTLQ